VSCDQVRAWRTIAQIFYVCGECGRNWTGDIETDPRTTNEIRLPLRIHGTPPQNVQWWIDIQADVAYISVRNLINTFDEFLDGVDGLISQPQWRPGIPVIQDLRECCWVPPVSSIAEWRAYVAGRQSRLEGCRWAVVSRHEHASVVSLLDAVAQDAVPNGVLLRHFTNMVDAHLWVQPSAPCRRDDDSPNYDTTGNSHGVTQRIKELRTHPDPYVTASELASYWGVSLKHIHKQVERGILEGVRLGPRHVRIRTMDAIYFEHMATMSPATDVRRASTRRRRQTARQVR
jgi:excisionase family DNA binding protein